MSNRRTLRLFVLCILILVLLALMGSGSLAAGKQEFLEGNETFLIHEVNGGGGNIGGYPLYDSGWHEIGSRPDPLVINFDHNLGGDPDDYLIKLECRDDTELGTYDCVSQNFVADAHWYDLTNSTISVWVRGGTRPDYIRVRIYIESPAYDSDWDDLGIRVDPIVVQYPHNLQGDSDEYIVNLTCNDTAFGIYDCVSNNFSVDANWFALTNASVNVWVQNFRPEAIRVRIYLKPNASFDSGWDELGIRPDPISLLYDHNLGGDPNMYFVDLECWDDTSLATYQCGDQGFSVNAHWYALTDTSVSVWVTGSLPDYVRVRIWTTHLLYLPFLVQE